MVHHSPLADQSESAYFLANTPVKKGELGGFYEYLRLTDFARYLQETGQSLEKLFEEAKSYYLQANDLCDQLKYQEAIPLYTKVAELVPTFYEALENCGFAYMDLGKFPEAINEFKKSLQVKNTNFTAQFSIGDSYWRMNEIDKSEQELNAALKMALEMDKPKDIELAKNLLEKVHNAKK